MLCSGILKILILVLTIPPSLVLAKRGGGHHGGGTSASSGGSGSSGGNSLPHFSLRPIDAAIFAICIVFTIITALQAIQAIGNIRKRISQQPPCITLPEFSVGHIFPTSLALSTVSIVITYALHGVLWATLYNTKARSSPSFGDAFLSAMRAMSYLGDIFLVTGILALISHRESVLVATSRAPRDLKMILDGVLVVILLAVGMGTVGMNVAPLTTKAAVQAADNLYVAYISFLLIAAVYIAISAIVLYVQARRSSVDDHRVVAHVAFIISPLFIIYSLCAIVLRAIQNGKSGPVLSFAEVDLVGLSVGCITEFIIIAVCLRFGMPVVPKHAKRPQEPVYKLVRQA